MVNNTNTIANKRKSGDFFFNRMLSSPPPTVSLLPAGRSRCSRQVSSTEAKYAEVGRPAAPMEFLWSGLLSPDWVGVLNTSLRYKYQPFGGNPTHPNSNGCLFPLGQFMDQGLEYFPPVLKIPEKIKTGTGRRQHHQISGFS